MKVVTLLFLLVMTMAAPRSYSEEGMDYQAQNDVGSMVDSEDAPVEEEVIPTDEEEVVDTTNSGEEF